VRHVLGAIPTASLRFSDAIAIAGLVLGLVTLWLHHRQTTAGVLAEAQRQAASQLLGPLETLATGVREADMAREEQGERIGAAVQRWRSSVDPLRPRLNPDLQSRVSSLEYFLDRSASGAIAMEPRWMDAWLLALVSARVAAQNYALGQRPDPPAFPSVETLEELIVKGQQLRTGVSEISEASQRVLFGPARRSAGSGNLSSSFRRHCAGHLSCF
jgi:hypothetical protein